VAWESELHSLQKDGTWVVEDEPPDRNIVGSRWLLKRKEDGRFKVRPVAKGFSQEPGIDFQETFAPGAKFTTLHVLLALIAENDWELQSMDVKTAFLNGILEEEIYMECPEGVIERSRGSKMCRLITAIDGLRQLVFVTGGWGGFSLARPRPYMGPTRTHSQDGAPFVTTYF